MSYRSIVLSSGKVEPRTETFNGRTYTVVPVVALVETVIHAMNAETAELVTAEEFSRAPGGWNGRPVFYGHPMRDGHPVMGNSPEVLEAEQIGVVFNAGVRKKKLVMEAWLDNERCASIAPALLERIAEGDPIEISVGAFVETDDEEGIRDGKAYEGKWLMVVPDHLALLPDDEVGACSREAGCGVRAAKGTDMPKKIDKTNGSLFARMMAAFRGAQPASEMSDNDLRTKLAVILREKDPRAYYPEAVYAEKSQFVYCVYNGSSLEYYRRDFTLAPDGQVTVGDTATAVEPVLSYEDLEPNAEPTAAAAPKTACSCSSHPATVTETSTTPKERNMADKAKVTETIKRLGLTEAAQPFLESATDEQLDSMVSAPAPVEPAVAEPAVASAAKEVTLEDLLAKSSQEVRDAHASIRAAAQSKRETSIKTLKDSGRNTFTDAELAAKSQGELDALVALVGAPKTSTDFSVNGARVPEASSSTEVPAPSDLGAAIRTARGQK